MLNKNSIAFAGQPPYLMERAAGYYEKIASRDWGKGDLLPIGGLFFSRTCCWTGCSSHSSPRGRLRGCCVNWVGLNVFLFLFCSRAGFCWVSSIGCVRATYLHCSTKAPNQMALANEVLQPAILVDFRSQWVRSRERCTVLQPTCGLEAGWPGVML